ncbi:MAG: HAD hydrolase-like protein [Acidimicrobiia bacterium]
MIASPVSSAPILLFDFDGTIVDSEPGIVRSWRHTFSTLSMPDLTDLEIRQLIGPPLTWVAEQFTADPAAQAELVRVYVERYDTIGLTEAEIYPGMFEALHALRDGGFRLMIATAKTEHIAKSMLESFALAPLFERVVGSLRQGGRRHKHEVIGHLLNELERDEGAVARTSLLMIGDRDHDVLGAAASGIDCIGVLWGYGTDHELASAGAACLAERPEVLVDQIRSRFTVR